MQVEPLCMPFKPQVSQSGRGDLPAPQVFIPGYVDREFWGRKSLLTSNVQAFKAMSWENTYPSSLCMYRQWEDLTRGQLNQLTDSLFHLNRSACQFYVRRTSAKNHWLLLFFRYLRSMWRAKVRDEWPRPGGAGDRKGVFVRSNE